MKIKILAILLSFTFLHGYSITNKPGTLKGIVVDSQNNEPIPMASIVFINQNQVTRTNESGRFTFTPNSEGKAKVNIKVSCVGYKTQIAVLPSDDSELEIRLTSQSLALGEVTVKKQKYRKKDNPAIELIEKVIANKYKNKKEAQDYYENEKYEKIQFAFNDISSKFKQKRIFKNFQFVFLKEDSVEGKTPEILPIYLKETLSNNYYRKSPKSNKEVIKSNKTVSFERVDNKGLEDNIKYMYQDINIYDNNITLLTNQFLSPIAPSAPSFYRYYITDTIQSGSDKYIKLFFGSKNKQDMLFQGFLYITLDGNYAIRGVELSVNKNINLNWVKDVKITQQFSNFNNEGWLLTSDETAINFSITKKGQSLLGKRTVSYKDYKFTTSNADSLFSGPSVVTLDSANLRSDDYWLASRHNLLSKSEAGTYAIIDSVQKVPSFRTTVDIATVVLQGYKTMGKWEIGPVNTFYSYNPIEGVRLRFGGRTTPAFSKKLNFESYIGYGLKDENLKYFLSSTWSFTPRSIYEFPVKSLKMSYQKDTKFPGQEMQFIQEDNILLSIKRGVNDKLFFNRTFKIEHLNEFENHFSYTLGYHFTKTAPGGNLTFSTTDYLSQVDNINNINISEFSLKLRYAPHEKFYQGKQFRIPVISKYPVIELSLNAGSKAWMNDFDYQSIKLSVSKRFYYSILGYSDVVWESGKIFGKVPYPLLNIHRANQTYSYQILSYNLMNFLEFVSDKYTSLNIDHCFNGFFLNKIPVIKHLELREYASFKVLYGSLSKTNDPGYNNDIYKFPVDKDGTPVTYGLGSTPYIEGSVGVGNIFKIFRLDLVKRFTYLNHPNIATIGLRMRFRFDF